MVYISKSPRETEKLAKKFLAGNQNINLFGLMGDLGSGKTVFVKGIAKSLGIKKNITSPTFVIMKSYPIKNKDFLTQGYRNLIHIDAYRLENKKDLEAIGYEESASDKQNLIFIEWPERVFRSIPKGIKIINFKYKSDNEREINL